MKSAQTDITRYLKQTSQEIEKELNKFSKEWNDYIGRDFPDLRQVNLKFTESFFGGKMLRGTLVKLGYELFAEKKANEIIKPAIAWEILHTALLIHDDIIDQSPLRRGKPAMHVARNKHYGISQAICAGDLGITIAVKLINESNFPIEIKKRATNYFLQIISDTILGEMLDVEISQMQQRTEEQIMNIHTMKTANYTIVGPLTLGGLLAGAGDSELEKIKLFGKPLGIAFQIQDDILGIFGDEKTIGKSITSDSEENKSTLLIMYALKHANQKQKKFLKQYYGKKKITDKQHEEIKKIFEQTGALSYSQNKIQTLTQQAKAIIPDITKEKSKQYLLNRLADLLIQRKK